MRHWVVGLAALVSLLSQVAAAQDDLLTPLTPEQPKPKSKPKPARRPPPHAKKAAPKPADDDLVTPLVKAQFLVRLTTPSQDATLYLDGVANGPVSNRPFEVSAGDHVVVIKRPGFADFSERVVAKDGQVTEVNASLVAVSGILAVTSDVPGSEALLDGNPQGAVPIRDIGLAPGTHEVTVHHEGYENDVSRIVVKAGKQYTVNAHLRPAPHAIVAQADRPVAPNLVPTESPPSSPMVVEEESAPVYRRWYVWAGAVAVVAAVVVTSAVVVHNTDTVGTPNPSAVCHGVCNGGCINATCAGFTTHW